MIIEGAIAVKSAIQNNKREVLKLYINSSKKTKDFNYIRKIAKLNNIEILELSNEELSKYLSGKSHGGIGGEVSERKYDEFIDDDIFFLDGIEDPFNLAYSLRTLYAFGFKNVLLNDRDYSSMENQLLKSSAGAYDMLNIKICKDPINELLQFKKNDYYLYSLYRSDKSLDVFETTFKKKSLFILGGEKRGISSSILDICDSKLYIPYGSDFRNALNACGALDVLATLVYKQRKHD